jgi:phosphoribosylformimino-5-aminoimidazole carboxamide ribotide isomerase
VKIIPAIDLLGGNVVRLVRGDPKNKVVYSNDPVSLARKWEGDGADALHVVDLDATLTQGNNAHMILEIIDAVRVPVQVAGGIRSVEYAKSLLQTADIIVLGTLAYKHIIDVEKLVREFGSERVVVAIDEMGGEVMIDGWRKNSGMKVMESIESFLKANVQFFLMTSIDRDGTLSGPDIDMLQQACSVENAKIIASGGISQIDDIKRVKAAGAYGVILGKALYDGKIDIKTSKIIAKENV